MEIVSSGLLSPLMSETNEIVAIVVSTIKTAKANNKPKSAIRNPK